MDSLTEIPFSASVCLPNLLELYVHKEPSGWNFYRVMTLYMYSASESLLNQRSVRSNISIL